MGENCTLQRDFVRFLREYTSIWGRMGEIEVKSLLFTRKLDTCCQAVRQRLYHARLQPHASKMHLKWAVIVTAHTVCVNSNSTFTGFPLVFTNNKFSNSPFISSCIGLTIIFRNSNWLFIASSASGTNINSENPEVAFGVFTVDVYTN